MDLFEELFCVAELESSALDLLTLAEACTYGDLNDSAAAAL